MAITTDPVSGANGPSNSGVYWVGADGNTYVRAGGLTGVDNLGNMGSGGSGTFNTQLNGINESLTRINDPNAPTTGGGGGGGGGGAAAPAANPYLDLLKQQYNDVQNTLPGLLKNNQTAHDNAVTQGNAAYDQNSNQNMSQYDKNMGSIADNGNGAFNSLMSLLGRFGQGGDPFQQDAIGKMLGGYTGTQTQGANSTYNGNKTMLDTNHGIDMNNWDTQLNQNNANVTAGVKGNLDNIALQMAGSGGTPPTPTGDILAQLQRSYSTPTYAAPSAAAMSQWSLNPTEVRPGANLSGNAPTTPGFAAVPQQPQQQQNMLT